MEISFENPREAAYYHRFRIAFRVLFSVSMLLALWWLDSIDQLRMAVAFQGVLLAVYPYPTAFLMRKLGVKRCRYLMWGMAAISFALAAVS